MSSLKDYIMRLPALSEGLCETVTTELKKQQWTNHTFVDYKNNNNYETDHNNCKTILDGTPLDALVMDNLFKPIQEYVTEKGKPFFKSWAGYTPVKYNKYEKGKSMKKHIDHIYSIFNNQEGKLKGIPTLSIIGALNNDYEGGAIEMFDNEKINLRTGEVLIFPSIFLYPHKVCEVTEGTRYSFVSWVY